MGVVIHSLIPHSYQLDIICQMSTIKLSQGGAVEMSALWNLIHNSPPNNSWRIPTKESLVVAPIYYLFWVVWKSYSGVFIFVTFYFYARNNFLNLISIQNISITASELFKRSSSSLLTSITLSKVNGYPVTRSVNFAGLACIYSLILSGTLLWWTWKLWACLTLCRNDKWQETDAFSGTRKLFSLSLHKGHSEWMAVAWYGDICLPPYHTVMKLNVRTVLHNEQTCYVFRFPLYNISLKLFFKDEGQMQQQNMGHTGVQRKIFVLTLFQNI